MSTQPIRVRRTGTASYPWQAHCRLCTDQTLHLVDGHGAAAANTRGVGNRTWGLALAAAHAHLRDHQAEANRDGQKHPTSVAR